MAEICNEESLYMNEMLSGGSARLVGGSRWPTDLGCFTCVLNLKSLDFSSDFESMLLMLHVMHCA